jgi:hypothetical protein
MHLLRASVDGTVTGGAPQNLSGMGHCPRATPPRQHSLSSPGSEAALSAVFLGGGNKTTEKNRQSLVFLGILLPFVNSGGPPSLPDLLSFKISLLFMALSSHAFHLQTDGKKVFPCLRQVSDDVAWLPLYTKLSLDQNGQQSI